MNNKQQLQQELLKKIKPGIKPSDLKNQSKNPSQKKNNLVKTESIVKTNEQLLTPPPTPPLKPSQEEDLPPPISMNQELTTELDEIPIKKPIKNETKTKPTLQPIKPTNQKPQLYLFTCSICEQNKKSPLHLHRVNGLGIDPHQLQKICDACFKKVDIIKERKEDFF